MAFQKQFEEICKVGAFIGTLEGDQRDPCGKAFFDPLKGSSIALQPCSCSLKDQEVFCSFPASFRFKKPLHSTFHSEKFIGLITIKTYSFMVFFGGGVNHDLIKSLHTSLSSTLVPSFFPNLVQVTFKPSPLPIR